MWGTQASERLVAKLSERRPEMYPDDLDDYLETLEQDDPAAQDAEEMEYSDWKEHWVVLDGELVNK